MSHRGHAARACPLDCSPDPGVGIEDVRKTLSTLARTVDMHGPLFDSAVGGAVEPQVQLLQAAVSTMQCTIQMVGMTEDRSQQIDGLQAQIASLRTELLGEMAEIKTQ